MPNRNYSNGSEYRYGFNGKENDKDAGESVQDYGMRIYDGRLGKFLSVDPLSPEYPFYSPYQFAGNSPIANIDLDGLEDSIATGPKTSFVPTIGTISKDVTKQLAQKVLQESSKAGGEIAKQVVEETAGKGILKFATKAGGLFVSFMLSSYETNGGENGWIREQLNKNIELSKTQLQPKPKSQLNPNQVPGKTDDGEEGYYIYETRRSIKKVFGIVEKNNIPYFGITKNAFVASLGIPGRYSPDSEEGRNGSIIGKTNYYTAKGVETAIILLNTKGYSSVLASTRVDNRILSTKDRSRLVSGILWLQKNYGNNWKELFLRSKNPAGPNNPDKKTSTNNK